MKKTIAFAASVFLAISLMACSKTKPHTAESLAKETPATEIQESETPAAETPVTESPATETQETETPETEAQKTETPATETPAAEKTASSTHTHSYTASVVDATCSANGYTKHTCSCGHSYNDSTVPAIGHLYGDWKTTVTPTTEKTGEKQCVCTRCGHVLTESIPVLENSSDDSQDGYIDPRIEVETYGNGARSYFYSPVGLVDTRTWGSRPSISITAEGGFQISYFKADGSKVSVSLQPFEGYINRCVILEDGSYTTHLIGDYS